jgi:hypothetical protein
MNEIMVFLGTRRGNTGHQLASMGKLSTQCIQCRRSRVCETLNDESDLVTRVVLHDETEESLLLIMIRSLYGHEDFNRWGLD